MELLGATRAQTSGLAQYHGAAGELRNGRICVKDRVFKALILDKTLASVPDWSEMPHSGQQVRAPGGTDTVVRRCFPKSKVLTVQRGEQ